MSTITKTNGETTAIIPAKYANTPLFIVDVHDKRKELPLVEATEASWAPSNDQMAIALTANHGAQVLVVATEHGQSLGTFLIEEAWIEHTHKLPGRRKLPNRLWFKFAAQLLGSNEVQTYGKSPRRGISML